MNIKNSPLRPILNIKITNPHTNKSIYTLGLIDTGADDCAFPSWYAEALGHDLKKGKEKSIVTGNGICKAYGHTSTIEILDFNLYKKDQIITLYKIPNVIIDFMPKLNTVLLGVKNFLSKFQLEINYPKKTFSLYK